MIMKFLIASSALFAVTAHAATFTSSAYDSAPASGQSIIADFDSAATGVSFSGSYSIDNLSTSGIRAAPYGDKTNYFATPGSASPTPGEATIDFSVYAATHKVTRVSFYWGSIDGYNTLTLLGTGLTGKTSFTGSDINNPANGDQSSAGTNRRVTFYAGPGGSFTGLKLDSASRAFEIDNVAGGVPEPAAWVMLVAGFAMVGGAARFRTRSVAA